VTRRTIAGLLASATATGVLAACGGASQTATGPSGAGAAQPGGPKTPPPAQIGFDTFRGGPNGVWAQDPAYVPANFRGTEFENAFPTFGTPWYKGETGFEDGLITLNTEVQKILDMAPI
jgi:hypothetical protein